jgi:hypothetical protein
LPALKEAAWGSGLGRRAEDTTDLELTFEAPAADFLQAVVARLADGAERARAGFSSGRIKRAPHSPCGSLPPAGRSHRAASAWRAGPPDAGFENPGAPPFVIRAGGAAPQE